MTVTVAFSAKTFLWFSFSLRNKAERAKNTAESVKQAMDDANKAQTAAEKAIQRARDDIRMTENRLAEVHLHKLSG